jgi:hypothetical protein
VGHQTCDKNFQSHNCFLKHNKILKHLIPTGRNHPPASFPLNFWKKWIILKSICHVFKFQKLNALEFQCNYENLKIWMKSNPKPKVSRAPIFWMNFFQLEWNKWMYFVFSTQNTYPPFITPTVNPQQQHPPAQTMKDGC